jgi:hypothetical protein
MSETGFTLECNRVDTRADNIALWLAPESFFTETFWLVVYYLAYSILPTYWVAVLIDTSLYALNTFFVVEIAVCTYTFTFCVTISVTVTSVTNAIIRQIYLVTIHDGAMG